MIKLTLTYKDLQEKEDAINKLSRLFVVKSISKEYKRAKGNDIYLIVDNK